MGSGEGLANCPLQSPHIGQHAGQQHLISVLVGPVMGDNVFDDVVIRVEVFPTGYEEWCAKMD